jgi:hypothetical protein
MLNGVGLPGLPGLGHAWGHGRVTDISGRAEALVDRLERRLEAGKLDTGALEERLEARFGEAADGIVGEDGSVDFERLETLIVETRSSELQDRLTERFGEAAEGVVSADGTVDKDRLEELVAARRVSRILDRLERRYGKAFGGVVEADGTIDFDALKALLAGTPPAEADASAESGETADVEESGDAEAAAATADAEAAGEQSSATGSAEDTAPSAVDQLTELRRILFQDFARDRFGDAADSVFTQDGEVDLEALRALFAEQRGGRFGHHGFGHHAAASRASFFDFRA